MSTLLLLFVALPALELALLIQIGRHVGVLETLALIAVTGVVGASLARSQGLRVLSQVQQQLAEGKMPTDSLTDGLMILLAAALLVTPGVLTDAVGLLCLIPAFRRLVKRELMRRFERALAEGRIDVTTRGGFTERRGPDLRHRGARGRRFWRNAPPRGPIVDVDADPASDSPPPTEDEPRDSSREE